MLPGNYESVVSPPERVFTGRTAGTVDWPSATNPAAGPA
jgi:hypothetical protein